LAIKLPVQTGGRFAGNKLWDTHQKNEYTHVDNYKEGVCWFCFKRKVVSAMVMDICKECLEKRGSMEATLAGVGFQPYGLCYKCGRYQFELHRLNLRTCLSCFARVRKFLKAYNLAGGVKGADPFWKHLRKKFGKDYNYLWTGGRKF